MLNLSKFLLLLASAVAMLSPARAETLGDWPEYLYSVQHNSFTATDAITPDNIATLHKVWRFKPPASTSGQPSPQIFASPSVVGNRVYVGFNNGIFYAIDLTTGQAVWQRNLGYVPHITCSARGITSSATVKPDPDTGVLTVYVNGGDGYLYALNAGDGSVIWQSLVAENATTYNGYYNWTSPAVANGMVYVGLSSECDKPFVRGGVKAFSQATGALMATHWTTADGDVGAGVWSSIGVSSSGEVYATTGSTTPPPYPQGESYSMLQLDGQTLEEHGIWTVPGSDRGGDSDFGASPSFFPATVNGTPMNLVAACNKNGKLYAWQEGNVAAGPVWVAKINTKKVNPCFAATIYDGSSLYQAGNTTIINGASYHGSINRLDPNTGAFIWRLGLSGTIFGSASLNGAGILAVPTFDATITQNGTYFVDAATGAILKFIDFIGAKEFAQPIFAGRYVLLSPVSQGVNAYTP